MAENKTIQDVLIESVAELAQKAVDSDDAEYIRASGEAARNIAEALAWVKFPAQPH